VSDFTLKEGNVFAKTNTEKRKKSMNVNRVLDVHIKVNAVLKHPAIGRSRWM